MLQAMRASAKGLLVKGLIGLLVISFASWGVVDYLGGVAQRPVAVVGDREIGAYEVSEAYRAQLNQLRRRFQGQITPEQAQAFGLHQQVVDQLVNAAAVDEEADALNLAIADESIQTAIVNDPTFQDAQGRFVPDRFTGLLRQVNMSEGAFVSQQRQTMRRRQLTSAVGSGLEAPAPLLNAINAHRNEQRKLSYAIVPITAVPMPATPDDAAVKKFYEENPSQFTAPEFRNSVVLELTAQALSETIEVSEEELTARFAVERQRFERAERRTVEQINFPTKEAAEKAAKEIADGKDFYEVAEAAGNARADVNLGPRTKASLAVPAIRDAAFGLEVNEISAPVEAPLATSLVRVTAITPGVTVTLDDVREQIMSAVRQDKAGDEINALYDQVEDRRSEGATLAEIGKALNLPVKEFRAIDRQGNGVDGESVEGVLEPARVLPAIFAGQPGVEANPTELANGGFAWVDVLSIEASKLKTLDDVKAEATTALQEQLRRDALVALTDKIVADMRSGKALEAALTAALPDAAAPAANNAPANEAPATGAETPDGAPETAQTDASGEGDATTQADQAAEATALPEVKTSDAIRRAERVDQLPAAAVGQAFSLPLEGVGAAWQSARDGRAVFQVAEIIAAPDVDAQAAEQLVSELNQGLEADLLNQYFTALRQRVGAEVDQEALAAAISGGGAGGNRGSF